MEPGAGNCAGFFFADRKAGKASRTAVRRLHAKPLTDGAPGRNPLLVENQLPRRGKGARRRKLRRALFCLAGGQAFKERHGLVPAAEPGDGIEVTDFACIVQLGAPHLGQPGQFFKLCERIVAACRNDGRKG